MATENSANLALLEEILMEILSRLPVKSLLKFRCVSKSWLSLISSPKFVKYHLQVSTKNNMYSHDRLLCGFNMPPAILYSRSLYPEISKNSPVETVPFDCPVVGVLRVVGSCNGLVCIAMNSNSFILWNPATKKSKQLPISGRNAFALAYGFGYDTSTDDYKVVESGGIPGMYQSQVKIYSSRANAWRIVHWLDGNSIFGEGVFVSGAVHWTVCHKHTTNNWVIIALNMTTENCEIASLPNFDSEIVLNVILGTAGGSLCASCNYFGHMDVWMLREYGVDSSWTKLVRLPYFSDARSFGSSSLKPFFVLENGRVVLQHASGLVMYKESEFHEIHPYSNYVEGEVTTYTESLISPDFQNEAVRDDLEKMSELLSRSTMM